MCGKFAAGHLTQSQMLEIMENFLGGGVQVANTAPVADPGFNVCPTNQVQIAYAEGDTVLLSSAKWQMTPPNSSKPLINSKIENVEFWRRFWERGRCIIPALGYYEWSGVSGRKEPYFITVRRNAPVMFFAGFFASDTEGRHSCSIVTRRPAAQIAHLHNRMPVILTPEEIQDWLTQVITAEEAQDTLGASWDGRFEYHRVKPIQKGEDGPELIDPYDPPQSSFDF